MVVIVKKVTDMEGVQKPISIELSKPCIVDYQEFEIFRILIPKEMEFLERFHKDIEKPLYYFLGLLIFSFYQR